MSRFFDPKLAGLKPYTPGEQPKSVAKLIKLNTNENPYPPAPGVQKALEDLRADKLALYPDPQGKVFKEALSQYFDLDEEYFTVGNGSDEILAFIFMGLCGSGVTAPDISYSFYPVLAQLNAKELTTVALREDFTWAPEDYAQATGTIIIANPNAPTGIAAPLSSIEELVAQDANRLVVVDEAYVDFGGQSAVSLVPRYDNLVVVRTLSKSRSLAGMRVAFAVAQPDLIACLEAIRNSFNPYNLDRLALACGAAAMADRAYFEETRSAIINTRQQTAQQLEVLGFKVLPSATNFLFASPPGMAAADYVAQLRSRNIIVRYFTGPRVSEFARISIGTPEEMARFVEASQEILAEQGQ